MTMESDADTLALLLKAAFEHHLHGRLAAAEAAYREVLTRRPDEPTALAFLAGILFADARDDEAEALYLRLLAPHPDDATALHGLGRLRQRQGRDDEAVALFERAAPGLPHPAPLYNDLCVSLHRLGRRDEALAAVDRALALDPGFGLAHDNRGLVLYGAGRFAEAAAAHLAALRNLPADADTPQRIALLMHLAEAADEARDLKTAEMACAAVLEFAPQHEEAMAHRAKVLGHLGRDADAIEQLDRLARQQGVVRKGPADAATTVLLLGAVGAGHVPTRYLFDAGRIATLSLTLLSPQQPDAPLGGIDPERLAAVDLIFNTAGDADRDGGQSAAIAALAARLGRPLLNPPQQVARTARQRAPELYAGIPGLVVPAVRRIERGAPLPDANFARPLLVRPAGTHGGEDLVLVTQPEALAEYLGRMPQARFLGTDFHDFADARGIYRKYRFIFVDRVPYPYHLAIGERWLLHYWRTEMAAAEWKRREEAAFLADWRRVFGRAAATVEAVARRLDLDYGGMDCSLLANGDVLFFEANACMLVHCDDDAPEFAYKRRAVPAIRDAMTDLLRRRQAAARD